MRVIVLVLFDLVLSVQTDQTVDPNCPDYELNQVCKEVCYEETFKCISNCNLTDSNCISNCLRAEATCVEKCPCGSECVDGCRECKNPICECSDVTLNENWNNCMDGNGQSLARCIYNCADDEFCETDCVRQFKVKTDDCPCEANCISGCPCDSFECNHQTTTPVASTTQSTTTTAITTSTATTTTVTTTTALQPSKEAVLLLSTKYSSNVPMVIDFEGNVDDDTVFTYDTDTEVDASCAATLNGEFWVIGGNIKRRQLSKIQDCRLKRIGDLDFDYRYGGCNTFSFGILLCFSDSSITACHSFDGNNFKMEPSSNYPHRRVNVLGLYKGQPFVTGSNQPSNIKTEILDDESNQWNQVADYPFSSDGDRIAYYATTSTEESVYIIGGFTYDSSTSSRTPIIAEYKNNQWRNAGSLNQSRYAHGAITSGVLTMVIGGSAGQALHTEILEFGKLENRIVDPTLSQSNYREVGLFLVDIGYCKKT